VLYCINVSLCISFARPNVAGLRQLLGSVPGETERKCDLWHLSAQDSYCFSRLGRWMTSGFNIVDMWHIMYLKLKIYRPREGWWALVREVCASFQGGK
jgi:hypothetical protein